MEDTALYQYLLGLQSPWTMRRMHLAVAGHRVGVWAEHPEDVRRGCVRTAIHLPAKERQWLAAEPALNKHT
jgi:hypothetical protein